MLASSARPSRFFRLDINVTTIEPVSNAPRLALLIEDDDNAADYTASQLRASGWRVDIVTDGADGLSRGQDRRYDVIIVDRMLPTLDGLSLVGALRAKAVQTPVVFITAMGSINDRVDGLEGGGDDYLVKPFSIAELLARLNVIIRRRQARNVEAATLRAKTVVMDRLARIVTVGDTVIDLLPIEFKLLELLLLHVDQVLTRAMLLQKVWGFKFDPQTNIVESHISRLRSKMDAADVITTVRGAGYLVSSG